MRMSEQSSSKQASVSLARNKDISVAIALKCLPNAHAPMHALALLHKSKKSIATMKNPPKSEAERKSIPLLK